MSCSTFMLIIIIGTCLFSKQVAIVKLKAVLISFILMTYIVLRHLYGFLTQCIYYTLINFCAFYTYITNIAQR